MFQLSDIEGNLLVYIHSGNRHSLQDQFKLDVSDGIHQAPITGRVTVRPVKPAVPVVTIQPENLDITVEVADNGIVLRLHLRIADQLLNMSV